MDIINFAKSDLGIAIAWIATVLSLALTIWSMVSKNAIKNENISLKSTIKNLNQQIEEKKVKQVGEKNQYVETVNGTMNVKF
ncbi:hypothetical protein V8Q13_13895 [Acinetobacter baumannii]|uniref:hypothetical protein n=1 Tax=Acinetobacter baumannii TaxID=470 RepID=UPI0021CA370E|nr:hypothetical protein [Acinetobacter baumannii]EHU1483710.1 hypothetical protein [Acinetobacter baumannii]EHU2704080.1 hypothetical protein [Acinetobacter baumannii]